MKALPTISIIIPIYNSEKYISRCLDSILEQDFTNYEIILIDDGSQDLSGAICSQYTQKHNNIKFLSQENTGVSGARNLGLKYAQGQYICFIDSDDWIEKKYLNNFQFGYDFCIQGYIVNTDQEFKISYTPLCLNQNTGSEIVKRGLQTAPWAKLFKREIIEKHSITFPENISYGEDSIFIYKYLTYCRTAVVVSGSYYHYIVYPNSLGHKKYPQKDLIEMFQLQYVQLCKLFKPSINPFNYLHYKTLLTLSELIRIYKLKYTDITNELFLNEIKDKYLHIEDRVLLRFPNIFNVYVKFYSKIRKFFNKKL